MTGSFIFNSAGPEPLRYISISMDIYHVFSGSVNLLHKWSLAVINERPAVLIAVRECEKELTMTSGEGSDDESSDGGLGGICCGL